MEAQKDAARLRALAHQLELSHVAFASAEEVPRHVLYQAWLAADYAGEMKYLHRDAQARRSPQALLPSARTVMCVALSYLHQTPDAGPGLRGIIARYARGEDYHLVLGHRLKALAQRIIADVGHAVAYRVCVDTAPLLEREAAARAGLGFQGKNTLLITPGVGSYTVLGELLLDFDVEVGRPEEPRCGACRLCLDVCPTGALRAAYQIDARRCISYLTIELVGPIPRDLRPLIGTWVFGCDLCQEVCPWNAAERPGDDALRPRAGQSLPELSWLMGLGAAQFRRFVKRTSLRRIHHAQLLRNAAVALGNAGTCAEVPLLARALLSPAPLVRQHVAWALAQIARREPACLPAVLRILHAAVEREGDAEVLLELRAEITVLAPGEVAA